MDGKNKRYYVPEEKYNIFEICLGTVCILMGLGIGFFVAVSTEDIPKIVIMVITLALIALFLLGFELLKECKTTVKKYVKEEMVKKHG